MKMVCLLKLPDYLWGIETQDNQKVEMFPNLSFQTTYEELKLVEGMVSRIQRVASRLPMRNWNYN